MKYPTQPPLKGEELSAGRLKGVEMSEARLKGEGISAGRLKGVEMSEARLKGEEVFVAFEPPVIPEGLLGVVEYLGRRY